MRSSQYRALSIAARSALPKARRPSMPTTVKPDALKCARYARMLRDTKVDQPFEQIVPPVRMSETNHPDSRLVETGDAVEDRGFAGAVRSDDCGDVATLRTE